MLLDVFGISVRNWRGGVAQGMGGGGCCTPLQSVGLFFMCILLCF